MTEKWEQKAVHMNFKKGVILFLITCLVLMISVPAALYGNFHNRIAEWEQVREHGENERDSRENDESDSGDGRQEGDDGERGGKEPEEIYGKFHGSWGDLALLTGCAAAGLALGIWYWLLVMIWACRKAYRMGVDVRLAVLAALFFNLAAVAVLALYGMLKGTCANCGRIRNGKFCDRCGNPLKKECPQCGQETDMSWVYCSNCGKKLNGDIENEK